MHVDQDMIEKAKTGSDHHMAEAVGYTLDHIAAISDLVTCALQQPDELAGDSLRHSAWLIHDRAREARKWLDAWEAAKARRERQADKRGRTDG